MRLFSFLIATFTLLSGVIAVDIQKSVLVTYPPETPNSVVNQAKKAIVDAGGMITHEYTLIKYVSANATIKQPSYRLLRHGMLTILGASRPRSARKSSTQYQRGDRTTMCSSRRTKRSTSWVLGKSTCEEGRPMEAQ